jgi:hypothetical protein
MEVFHAMVTVMELTGVTTTSDMANADMVNIESALYAY